MNRILREPLVHFLVLGAIIFALYAALRPESATSEDDYRVVVTEGQIEHLATTFPRVWLRPPTASELKSLIDEYIKEDILSREAIKLGLDRNDTVIRRRLQQKMEFIAEDFSISANPGDEELAEFLAAHPERFQRDSRYTFQQVYLDPGKHGENLETDVATLLAGLSAGAPETDIAELGDSLMLPTEIDDQPQFAITSQFGQDFAAALAGLPTGEWTGPVRSGYGVHLVRIESRTEGHVPELREIRAEVQREWLDTRRKEANQKFLDALLAEYSVTVEWPGDEPIEFQPASDTTQ